MGLLVPLSHRHARKMRNHETTQGPHAVVLVFSDCGTSYGLKTWIDHSVIYCKTYELLKMTKRWISSYFVHLHKCSFIFWHFHCKLENLLDLMTPPSGLQICLWPRVTLTFDLLTAKIDRFMREWKTGCGHLMPLQVHVRNGLRRGRHQDIMSPLQRNVQRHKSCTVEHSSFVR